MLTRILVLSAVLSLTFFPSVHADTTTRKPWTSSQIRGTPEPPPPYLAKRVYPNVAFKNPVVITTAPGDDRFYVAEQTGRIFSVTNTPDGGRADLFFDLPKEIKTLEKSPNAKGVVAVYGLEFHPDFETNRYCYICYVLSSQTEGEELPEGTRVSRFSVNETDPPSIDPDSEEMVITWLGGGHNGGCLKFGPDGYLYIATGDATTPNPPDALHTGQDLSDLLSSILRIDINRKQDGLNYAIPPDNPFVNMKGIRPENWAYGFRNPWKMSFDRKTGELWTGDVGWELWELVHKVEKGGNYGWSIKEGRQPVNIDDTPGPTPIRSPLIELSHSIAASVTGGFVYRGKRFPDLQGAYVFGDWETRRIWAARFEDGRLVDMPDILPPTVRIVAFGEDHAGELYMLDYDAGTIHTLEKNPEVGKPSQFPTKLSETGLLKSVAAHQPYEGVYPFQINVENWMDGAMAQRIVAIPGHGVIEWHGKNMPIPGSMFNRQLVFPPDSVLAKTISVSSPHGPRRVETQLLHLHGNYWNGYTYRWNDAQSDAVLVPAEGAAHLVHNGDQQERMWTFHSRIQCIICHTPWAQNTLAFNIPQLRGKTPTDSSELSRFERMGLIQWMGTDGQARPIDEAALRIMPLLTNSPESSVTARARSYLHANCSHCHRMGGGGSTNIDLRMELPIDKTLTIDVPPMQGRFDMDEARIIAPGDPYRSVLYYRMAKTGRGRMPHIGSEVVDPKGLQLIHDWIREMSPTKQPQSFSLDSVSQIGATSDALALAHALALNKIAQPDRSKVINTGAAHPAPHIRDLFERFLPASERRRRLGNNINPASILALSGNADQGKQLYWNDKTMQCRNCHRIEAEGGQVGPDLTHIGKTRDRAALLDSLLNPSRDIEPEYAGYLVETKAGLVYTGTMVKRTGQELVLRDAENKELRVRNDEIEFIRPGTQSLMPEFLLRDLTAQEAADLLAYLESLR